MIASRIRFRIRNENQITNDEAIHIPQLQWNEEHLARIQNWDNQVPQSAATRAATP